MKPIRAAIALGVAWFALGEPAFGQGGFLQQEADKGSNYVRKTVEGGGKTVERWGREVGQGAAELDPTTAARENLERLQAQARSELPRIKPEEILNGVREALNQPIAQEIRSHGAAYNIESGDLDLRGTSMGRFLTDFAKKFAQGNQRFGQVDQFDYNVPNKRLTLRLTVRHHQRDRIDPLGEVDIYDDTQHAKFSFDFNRDSASYEIDFGGYIPPYTSETYEKLSEGDLVGAAEMLTVPVPGNLVKYIRRDDFVAAVTSLQQQWGQESVFVPSKTFVDWASPDTLAKYTVNGVLSLGASVYPEIMGDVRQMAENELPGLVQWLGRRNIASAEELGRELLSGRPSPLPFIEFRLLGVEYVAYEGLPGGEQTPDRREEHLMFAIIWHNQGQEGGNPGGGAGGGPGGGPQQEQGPTGQEPSGPRPLIFVNRSGFQLQVFARWQNPETGEAIDRVIDSVDPDQSLQLGTTGNPLVFLHANYIDAAGNVGAYVDGNDGMFNTPTANVGLRKGNAAADGQNFVITIPPPS